MTTLAASVAPTPTPYIFWLATWHNLPVPLGQPRCCRITRASLEIDITENTCWSIPLSSILACERHVQHDGVANFFLYARLTLDAVDTGLDYPCKEEVFLGALDPISQEWDWKETVSLINLLTDLQQHTQTAIHANPYYRALERRGQLNQFSQLVYALDPQQPPADYARHPLLLVVRRQSTRQIGLPLLVGMLCLLMIALLFWLETANWIIMSSAIGIVPWVAASFWPTAIARRFPFIA